MSRLMILLITFFLLMSFAGIGAANEITVQSGSSIQAAVDAASSGDTIIIGPGTYTENVKITKGSLTIRSESGNPDDTMIKANNSKDNALFVQADNVKISGIKAAAASAESVAGICLSGCNNCVIENNKLTSDGRGIYLLSSKGCTISGNTVVNNGYYGILLQNSISNTVSGNTVTNSVRGIYMGSSDDNIVSSNTVTLNSVLGYYSCSECDRNLIYNNYFNNTEISVKTGSGNSFNTTKTSGTNIIGGSYIGGNYWGKPDGTGFSNTAVDNNGDGIADSTYTLPGSSYVDYLPLVYSSNSPALVPPVADFSSDVTSGNAPLTVTFKDGSTGAPTGWDWNFGDGEVSTEQNPVHTYASAGTYTVKLTVSNADGSASKDGTITVLQTSAPVVPVADFSSSAMTGSAPLEVSLTDMSTGSPTAWNWDFGDGTNSADQNSVHTYTSAGTYTITLTVSNANGTSSKTLDINVLEAEENNGLPIADFSANVTSGYAPLAVLFTDLSQNAAATGWDFNNDGVTDASSSTIVYVYPSPGTYTVNLLATNENGTVSKALEIDVIDANSSGGSSHHSSGGSSGGGGTGGSPEPQRNVASKDTAKVFVPNEKQVIFNFANNVTTANSISFASKKTKGKITAITEDLKNKSTLVSELPDGEIYKSFNVWVGNAGYGDSDNILNASICFKVNNTWIQENNIDQSSICLYKYDDESEEWTECQVTPVSEDKDYLYFTAEVPGFSSFVIAGNASSQVTEEPVSESTGGEVRSAGNGTITKGTPESPGFGIISGVVCVLGIFLYRRK